MNLVPRVWAVVPAAGRGARFDGEEAGIRADTPKQYAPLLGSSVIGWSLKALTAEPRIAGIVVVLAATDADWPGVAQSIDGRKIRTAIGGVNRQDSVISGLRELSAVAAPGDWAMVHDAARPCLSRADLARLLDALATGSPGSDVGAVLAAPVVDTVKRERDGVIAETVERHGLWRALTPQVFRFAALLQALEAAQARGVTVTDEAQAMELVGGHGALVAGSPFNIKITRAEDLALARQLLNIGE